LDVKNLCRTPTHRYTYRQEVRKYLFARGVDQTRIQGESNGHDITKTDSWEYLANSLEFKFINKVIIRAPARNSK